MERVDTLRGFGRIRKSLRFQLFVWVTLTLVLAICINLYLSFRSASATANLVVDRTLLASSRVIAEAVHTDAGGTVQLDMPPAALEMFDTGYQDRVYYQVTTPWGSLISGFPNMPKPSRPKKGEQGVFRGEDVRMLLLTYPVVGLGQDGEISVIVAVTQKSQFALRNGLWFSDFGKQLILVLLAGLVAIAGLQWGLGPVLKLSDMVRHRGRDRLDPLPTDMVQTELRPLVLALNGYMERVQAQMSAQRRFVSNAAHQLRTPLALLSTQASFAARERDADRRDEALQALQNSTRQVARLAAQLLTLSRAEPGSRRPRRERIDMAAAARQIMETQAEEALSRDIDLGLEAERAVIVSGDGLMLREMMVNLIDNALHYTPRGGRVTVTVSSTEKVAIFSVEDSGPGIPEAEREQVFERFYRMPSTEGDGSGLGLAIVREVAEGAGGRVFLGQSADAGLLVTVELPASETA